VVYGACLRAQYLGFASSDDLEELPGFEESFPAGLQLRHAFEVHILLMRS
jgi:hypothetical protein